MLSASLRSIAVLGSVALAGCGVVGGYRGKLRELKKEPVAAKRCGTLPAVTLDSNARNGRSDSVGYLPSYTVRTFPEGRQATGGSQRDPDTLRLYLRERCFEHVLNLFFPNSVRPRLVDWIVYIDKQGEVYQGLVKDRTTRRFLDRERYVWALVFSDHDLPIVQPAFFAKDKEPEPATASKDAGNDTTKASSADGSGVENTGPTGQQKTSTVVIDTTKDTLDLRFVRRVVDYQRDPLLTSLIKGLAGFTGVTDIQITETKLGDSSTTMEFKPLSGGDTLWVAQGRFGLPENAEVQLSLSPVRGKEFAPPDSARAKPSPIRSVYTNLANAQERLWDVGLMGGVTMGVSEDRVDDAGKITTTPNAQPNAFLMAAFNPSFARVLMPWKKPPWQRSPVGLVLGTNIARGSFADQLITGIGVGRVAGDIGVTFGVNWLEITTGDETHRVQRRRARPFVGIDLRL